ncbi:MAG: hypothetical protein ACI9JO_001796 [Psychrobacter okhotskensis]
MDAVDASFATRMITVETNPYSSIVHSRNF